MRNNMIAWSAGILSGLVSVAISAFIFVLIAIKTGYIFGFVSILCGVISGGIVGLIYKLANGRISNRKEARIFLFVLTIFGLLGVLAAYALPFFLFNTESFIEYLSIIDFDLKDVLFIVIGAFGGRWVGKKLAWIMSNRSTLKAAGLLEDAG
jgi:hypothetical protein